MNSIFEKLVRSKIDHFLFEYTNLSRSVFVNTDGSLIHPGEFGMYRERIVSDLIKPFLPEKYAVGTGFIITSQDKISTQCDLIIYDREHTPVIENEEQRFFPVECVVGVIEVKSKLQKTELKEALFKLARIKELRKDIGSNNPYVFKDGNYSGFNPTTYIKDQIATFLVCESFEFNIEKDHANFFSDVYSGIDKSLYHNMILSLNDGLCLYHDGKSKVIYCPYFDYSQSPFRNVMVKPSKEGYAYEHIMLFVDYFYMLISSVSVMYIEMTEYISQKRSHTLIC